ncbi:MAG: type II methionyl aminopeptidase [Candidatus Anstonellales archaeon]
MRKIKNKNPIYIKKCMSIYRKILDEIDSIVIIDVNVRDICESIEEIIINEGYDVAFPVNVSINEIAAHSTASFREHRTVAEDDLVKIDFGYITETGIVDNAISINLSGKHKELIEATKESVDKAIAMIKPDVTIDEVSGLIQDHLSNRGFKPISNLTGHRISEHIIHDEPSVPAVRDGNQYRFKVGDRFAIEVFATYPDGSGVVVDTKKIEIFSLIDFNKSRVPRSSLRVYEHILNNYRALPFAKRWLASVFGETVTNMSLRELYLNDFLDVYPELKEKNGKVVAQYERTILVEENGAKVLE